MSQHNIAQHTYDFLHAELFYLVLCRPKSVAERLVCHAIIGKNPHKERIMTVDILANFISPLTQFSTREISFTVYQVEFIHVTNTNSKACTFYIATWK